MDSPQLSKIILSTHRFVFSDEIVEYIDEFSKIHQYDERKTFKENWGKWIKKEDIEPIINDETKRLKNLGYKGDVLTKMFKSARYYYRNKPTKSEEEEDKKDRKSYEKLPLQILEQIDVHINKQINMNAFQNTDSDVKRSIITPAECFNNYLIENKQEILKTIQQNRAITKHDIENIIKRYKKTYKNRFYNIRVNLNNQ
jgi:hypothetical protein